MRKCCEGTCGFLLLFFFWIYAVPAVGQNKRLDSLLSLNNQHHSPDSVKCILLKDIARSYLQLKNPERMELYIDSALLVASRLPTRKPITYLYNRLGAMFHNADRFRAIQYYNKAIENARQTGYLRMEGGSLLNLGALYMTIQDYPKSLDAHEQALRTFTVMRDTADIASCYMNMSYIYNNMGQKEKGMEYIKKALRSFETDNQGRGMAVAYQEIASTYMNATDQELQRMGVQPANRWREAASVLDKGLKKSLFTADESLISSFYAALGKLNERLGDVAAAKRNYLQAVAILKDKQDEESYPDNLVYAGRFLANMAQEKASGLALLHEALVAARKNSSMGSVGDALGALSSVHERTGDYDSALIYFKKEILVRDSIFSREKEQEITRRQMKIDFDIREKDYQNAQQLSDIRLRQQQQEILLRNQQLQISDKEKRLQRLVFLQRQAELQKQKEQQAGLLHREQMESEYRQKTSAQEIGLKNVQLASNRRLSLFLAVVVIVMIVAAMLIYQSRRKTVRLNRLVSEQKQSLEELVDVKDKIFSIVSHDLRGPVNNIVALSSIIEEEAIEKETLQLYVNQIKRTLDHTSTLMENLLNWSASQMKGFRPVIEHVDICQVAERTLAGMDRVLQNKHLKAVNKLMPGLYVSGDRNMIELIMRNLLSNAIKFSRPGDMLELSADRQDAAIVFAVKDNGVGMAETKVQYINNPAILSVESTSGTQKEKGTGLGLMLCKHFAAMMGGTITVKSAQGQGSRFYVALPAAV
ncbi:tetratricopeptide repeat-containing sensor histidine kinase [Sediminibacterium soli]|uniref:tetratricopeptide repeat-containing sensor histidine kinase n=1 Tax=Sediminibacterium soli TaxID=2698829 RepID=UPI00137A0FEE|nr:tetratricopeptide repeat-containing sensor histidine kinase [Sediminibacterium soli]NCI46524.1 tetratricopeptide repeat protein [Sediminibacterium soli]